MFSSITLKAKLIAGGILTTAIGGLFLFMYLKQQAIQLELTNAMNEVQRKEQIILVKNEDIRTLEGNVAGLKVGLATQAETIDSLQYQYHVFLEQQAMLQRKLHSIEAERDAVKQELDNYQGRLTNVSLKKPTLVELRANRATTNVLRDFGNATDPRGSEDHNDTEK